MTSRTLLCILLIKKELKMQKILVMTVLGVSTMWAGSLTVEVTNISGHKGRIAIGLYNNAKTFGKMSRLYKGARLTIRGKRVVYTFKHVPRGTYAISVMHDANNNKTLDKNVFGIPKEGYGFSNNVHHAFRAATFGEAKFSVTNHKKITIRMHY